LAKVVGHVAAGKEETTCCCDWLLRMVPLLAVAYQNHQQQQQHEIFWQFLLSGSCLPNQMNNNMKCLAWAY
jgi:hypothetical protein